MECHGNRAFLCVNYMEELRVDDAGGSVDKQQDKDGGQAGFDYDMKQLLQRPALFLSKVSSLLLGNIFPERVLNGTEKETMVGG